MRYPLPVLTALTAFVAAANACSPLPECPYGTWPFDGATGIAADTVITFHASDLLPADLPALHEAFSLVDETSGETVNFGLELGDDQLTVTLTPDLPLVNGHTYRADGLIVPSSWQRRYRSTLADNPAHIAFTVGGAPQLIEALQGEAELYVVWSSDLTPDVAATLTVERQVGEAWEPVTGLDAPEVLADAPNVLVQPLPAGDAYRVSLGGGAPLEPTDIDWRYRSVDDLVAAYTALPFCRSY